MLGRSSGVCVRSDEECLAGVRGLVGEHLDAFVVGEAGVRYGGVCVFWVLVGETELIVNMVFGERV